MQVDTVGIVEQGTGINVTQDTYDTLQALSLVSGEDISGIVSRALSEWVESTGSLLLEFMSGQLDGAGPSNLIAFRSN